MYNNMDNVEILRGKCNNVRKMLQKTWQSIDNIMCDVNNAVVELPQEIIESARFDKLSESDRNANICSRIERIIKVKYDVGVASKILWGMNMFYNISNMSDDKLIRSIKEERLEDDIKRIEAANIIINDARHKLEMLVDIYEEVGDYE